MDNIYKPRKPKKKRRKRRKLKRPKRKFSTALKDRSTLPVRCWKAIDSRPKTKRGIT